MYGINKQIKSAGSASILFAHKASMLLDEKSTEEALSLCEEGVKFFPFYAEGHFVLAKCYHSKGNLDDAKKEYEKVLYYLPGHLKALKALAYIYFKHEQESEAKAVLQNFVLYDPLNSELIEFLKSKGYYKELTQPSSIPAVPDVLDMPETAESGVQDEKTYSAEDILSSDFDTEADEDEVQPEVQEYDEVPVLNLDGDDADVPYDAAAFNEDLPEDASIPSGAFLNDKDDNADEETRQDQYEINNIVDTIDEKEQDDSSINLDDFDNTKDDFSTIIDDVFDKLGEDEQKDELADQESTEGSENQETDADAEVEAEERPMLDTTIIFNEQRSGDQDTAQADEKPAESIDQITAGIEKDSSERAAEIEAGMAEMVADGKEEESTESLKETAETQPPAASEILSELDAEMDVPETEDAQKTAEVTEQAEIEADADEPEITLTEEPAAEKAQTAEKIIEEKAEMPSAPIVEKTVLPDDEHVEIEDILSNPSLLTPTFGEILIAQRKFDDARQVFMELSKRQPDDERIKKKIKFLEKIVAADKNK